MERNKTETIEQYVNDDAFYCLTFQDPVVTAVITCRTMKKTLHFAHQVFRLVP